MFKTFEELQVWCDDYPKACPQNDIDVWLTCEKCSWLEGRKWPEDKIKRALETLVASCKICDASDYLDCDGCYIEKAKEILEES